jgi:hypothetical protein
LLRRFVAILDYLAGFICCLTALIHCSSDAGICGIFECHLSLPLSYRIAMYGLLSSLDRLNTEKVGGHRGTGESSRMPAVSPITLRRTPLGFWKPSESSATDQQPDYYYHEHQRH